MSPALTRIDPDTFQVSSTDVPDALSDTLGGWSAGSQEVDPYTNAVGGGDEPVHRPGPGYVHERAAGRANPNAFTSDQNVDVYSGRTGGLLESPDLLASNGPIQSSAPQLTADQVGVLLAGSTPVGRVLVSGTVYSQSLVNVDGVPTYLYYNDRISTWWTEPAPITATQATPAPVASTSGPAQGPGGVGANSIPVAAAGAPMTIVNPPIDWTTQTEWAYPAPDRRLIQPVTHYDSGSRGLNLVLNKVVLPLRNALAFYENVPLATLVAIDDALRHSPFEPEYRAAQDMMPLEGTMGLTMEVGPAVDYAATWLSTSSEFRSVVKAPVFWFMGAGGGGFVSAPRGVPAVVDAAADLPALAPELATSSPTGGTNFGLGYGYGSLAEEAATVFQGRVRRVESLGPGGRASAFIRGHIGEERSLFEHPNWTPIGEHVTFDIGMGNFTVDYVFVAEDGHLVGVESKFGPRGQLTGPQSRSIPHGGGWVLAVPKGDARSRAAEAGLTPGVPVWIEIQIERWNWGIN